MQYSSSLADAEWRTAEPQLGSLSKRDELEEKVMLKLEQFKADFAKGLFS